MFFFLLLLYIFLRKVFKVCSCEEYSTRMLNNPKDSKINFIPIAELMHDVIKYLR